MAAQTAVQARARDLGVDDAGHRQQVIQGQQEGLTQRCHYRFLGRGVEPLGAVRGIFHPLALAPFRNRVTVEVVSLGQFRSLTDSRVETVIPGG